MFVNTLAMRNFPEGEKAYSQFLDEVKYNSLKAYENQDYQFEELVSRLGIQPDPCRQSLFDTMFVLQNVNTAVDGFDGEVIENLIFKNCKFEEKITQFDIMFHAFERSHGIAFKLLYSTRIFKEESIRMMIRNFKEITDTVTKERNIKLKDITISHGLFDQKLDMPETDFVF
jgi:tyrocidine synthetase-3